MQFDFEEELQLLKKMTLVHQTQAGEIGSRQHCCPEVAAGVDPSTAQEAACP